MTTDKTTLEDETFTVEAPNEKQISKTLCKKLNESTEYDVDWMHPRLEYIQALSHVLEPKHGDNLLQKLTGGKLAWQHMKLQTVEEWAEKFEGDVLKIARRLHEKMAERYSMRECLAAIAYKVAPKMRGLIIGRSLVRENDRFVRASDNSDTRKKVDFGDIQTGSKIQLKSGNGSQSIQHFNIGESDTLAVYQELESSGSMSTYGIAFTHESTDVSGNDTTKMDPAYIRAREIDAMQDWVSGEELRAD